jgi:N,N-dimethylformamidase
VVTVTTLNDPFEILGYTNLLAVEQGACIQAMVSSPASYTAALVRLDTDRKAVRVAELGEHVGTTQAITTGSYVEVPEHPGLDLGEALTLAVWVYPTTPIGRQQAILSRGALGSRRGWSLCLRADGRPSLEIRSTSGGKVAISIEAPLVHHRWQFVIGSFDGSSRLLRLAVLRNARRWGPTYFERAEAVTTIDRIEPGGGRLLIAAAELGEDEARTVGHFFNGKLDSPVITRSADRCEEDGVREAAFSQAFDVFPELVAAWDFSQRPGTATVVDCGPAGVHGSTVNSPTRAVTGYRWTANHHHFVAAPTEYSAIHFHEDDLDDARWDASLECAIEEELPSGVYAIEVATDDAQDTIPFFVTPRAGSRRRRVVFLAPTLTYLAYANDHLWARTDIAPGVLWPAERVERPAPADVFLAGHPELGRSLYDVHSDGSGVAYASYLRPIVNLRPDYRYWERDAPRHFSADLELLRWLQRREVPYDVVTDHDVHADPSLLDHYAVVVTGSHPEYVSERILDALAGFLGRGGRLMYLGGNGFYWVTSIAADRPQLIEVRRGQAGSRNWTSPPGETYHSTTGELGGLWRHRGRPPQELVGIGFAAMGAHAAAGYLPVDHLPPDAEFIFDGRTEDVIGQYGRALGGAAGDEVDRTDTSLGTPPESVLLASSRSRHDRSYYRCIEDVMQLAPGYDGTTDEHVRADMIYLSYSDSGSVFATGSINWILALDHNDDDNDVSRITENVLRRFMSDV